MLSLQLFLGFGTDLTKGWLLGAVGSLEEIGVTDQTASTDRSHGHVASQLTSRYFLMFSPVTVAILFCSFTFLYDRNLLIVIDV